MGGSWFIDPKSLYETTPYITRDPKDPVRYVQIFQSIPALEPFYTEFEKQFDVKEIYEFMRDNKWIPVVGVILYLSFMVEGAKFMERRKKRHEAKAAEEEKARLASGLVAEEMTEAGKKKKKDGKAPWAVPMGPFPALWDLFLAIFSIAGAVRVVPHFLWLFTHQSFYETVCVRPDRAGYGDGAAGLWVMLFTVSKLFELLDTVILILKGKDPMFLHWYHHVTVLLYTWYAYAVRNPGLYFIAMNYTVHAVMYTYYFLAEVKLWPEWLSPLFITLMQISQMFVGVGVTIAGWRFKDTPGCELHPEMLPWCTAMYSTYLYFFIEFFVRRYITNPPKKSTQAKKND